MNGAEVSQLGDVQWAADMNLLLLGFILLMVGALIVRILYLALAGLAKYRSESLKQSVKLSGKFPAGAELKTGMGVDSQRRHRFYADHAKAIPRRRKAKAA